MIGLIVFLMTVGPIFYEFFDQFFLDQYSGNPIGESFCKYRELGALTPILISWSTANDEKSDEKIGKDPQSHGKSAPITLRTSGIDSWEIFTSKLCFKKNLDFFFVEKKIVSKKKLNIFRFFLTCRKIDF